MTARALPAPLVEHAVRFVHALRAAGLSVSIDQATVFAAALEHVDPLRPREVRGAARATLVTQASQRPTFERVFEAYWEAFERGRPMKAPRAPRHGLQQRATALSLLAAKGRGAAVEEIELDDRSGTATAVETLRRKDFSKLSEDEHRALREAMARMRWRFCERQTRRRRPSGRGQLDLREVVRREARGVPSPRLPRRGPKVQRRPLVLLADVSGSMELYSRVVLQLFHGLSRSTDRVESFVFGTRLTRITDALATSSVDEALHRVSDDVVDFSGGTRIGESLHVFNRRWARRILRRGAVVVVVSDGCEQGDPERVGDEMRRLYRRCHRVIWLNPRISAHYQPLAGGMAAALRWVDDFLPIGNLHALAALGRHLGELPRRPSATPTFDITLEGDICEAQR
ncbi:MAG: VWA domain-containing protein [Myxococcota bacterium]